MDRTVLITGASSGFGASCARAFAKLGYKLVLTARRKEMLDRLQQELAHETKVCSIVLDVRDRAAASRRHSRR